MKIIKSILCLTAFVCITVFSYFGYNYNNIENTTTKNWMKDIKDEVCLKDIVIPGSHDSGTYGTYAWGETQDITIAEQLEIGTRYFDIRLKKTNEEDNEKYENRKIYHMFATPKTFFDICKQIKEFIDNNPTEFLVLDFQHFDNEPYKETIEIIESILSPNKNALKNTNYIGNLSMGDIRNQGAKYMLIWGHYEPYMQYKKDYLFYRNYVLNSLYNPDWQSNTDEFLVNEAFNRYYGMQEEEKLFVLQAQKTGKDIYTLLPKENEENLSPLVNEFIKNLETDTKLVKTNIIMRDFLNKQKCIEIIKLNQAKNNIIEKNIEVFKNIK